MSARSARDVLRDDNTDAPITDTPAEKTRPEQPHLATALRDDVAEAISGSIPSFHVTATEGSVTTEPLPESDPPEADAKERESAPPQAVEPPKLPVEQVQGHDDVMDGFQFGAMVGRSSGNSIPGGAPAICLQACVEHPAGIVELTTGTHLWTLVIREDQLLDIQTKPANAAFTLDHALRTSGLVTDAELDSAISDAASGNQRLTDVILKHRLLRFRQLDAIVSARTKMMIKALFNETLHSYEIRAFESIEAMLATPTPIAFTAWSALKQLYEEKSAEELDEHLQDHLLDRPVFRSDANIGAAALKLTGKQRRFAIEIMDGATSITQLLARSPLQRRATLVLLVALENAKMLTWNRMHASSTRIARVWASIIEKQRLMGSANCFHLIDAHWSSDEVLVQEALQTTFRLLDLDYVEAQGTPEQRDVAAEVRAALSAVRDRLRSRDERKTERAKIVDDFNRRAAVELYEKQAELALFKTDFTSAIDSLRRVVELDPKKEVARTQLRTLIKAGPKR